MILFFLFFFIILKKINLLFYTGVAWLSSARVVKCTVHSTKRAQPLLLLYKTANKNWMKVRMKSSHYGLYELGYTCATLLITMGSLSIYRFSQPLKISFFGLFSEIRKHEVGIASNRRSARCGEYVPGPCTHRPSHHGSILYFK